MLPLYENIKKYRIMKGLSQEELAERVGYTGKSMVSRVENGVVDLSHSKIVQFADALGVQPAVLMGWRNDNPAIIDKETEALTRIFRGLSSQRRKKVMEYAREQYILQDDSEVL